MESNQLNNSPILQSRKGVNKIAKNPGKIFEDSFVKSVPNHILVKRLNDSASSWNGGSGTRFTTTNECDFIMFDDNTRTFYGLELKSTIGSLTFWREDFENIEKKCSFNIKKNQIKGLLKFSSHLGVFGFVFNFRNKSNQTYFVMIDEFLDYTNTLSKKSINIDDVLQMNPIKIDNTLLRTNYRYNLEKFFTDSKL
ncbi:PDDEXK family nuclease [Konateibacter massiliensis]|uniref:hypothetical protein n=1 Tax=Konateibacter massiliensis TaxID=2002841 RepID=UPI00117A7487|nr:hypothetical protein [Konateibacter massiliensis]